MLDCWRVWDVILRNSEMLCRYQVQQSREINSRLKCGCVGGVFCFIFLAECGQ